MSAPLNLVSVREFARLDGCDDKLVRRAITAGKLRLSEDGKLDAALVGSGWRRTNRRGAAGADIGADTTQMSAPNVRTQAVTAPLSAVLPPPAAIGDQPDPEEVVDFIAQVLAGRFALTGVAEQVKENALAAKNLLAARKEAGDLVDIEVAEAILFEQARQIRDAWMNWPARVGPLIAAELGVAPEPVVEALNKHVQQQLQDLGEPEAEFAEAGEG